MASRLRGRAVVIPTALVLAATGGAVAWAQSGAAASGYRTAVVDRGDVQQTLTLTGTVSVVSQAKARFRTSGTISAVKVAVGQDVTAGQVLATMETGGLSEAVLAARTTLATARATLETDSSSASSSSSSITTATPSASAQPKATTSSAAAQRSADDALRRASEAVQAAVVACATSPSTSPSPSATATSTASTAPTSTPSAVAPTSAGPKKALPVLSCAAALQQALTAQKATAQAQQELARALQSAAAGSSQTSASQTSASSSSDRPSQSASTSSAAKLTRDGAAVSAAEVALSVAEKDLASVTLTAPIAGTVASIPWSAGSTAATTDAITILGKGAVDVLVDVPSTSIRSITAGLTASVRSDGASKPVDGTVTAISLLPTDTSGSTSTSSATTYPVTVRVPAGSAMVDGSSASVTLAVKTARDVVTVPNSALHNGSVTVLSKGKTSTVRVTTGATGALRTEVTKGLSAGQVVVIADLSEALPTSSTTTNRNRVGGFNGPTNGTFPAGGFQGGPPTTVTRG